MYTWWEEHFVDVKNHYFVTVSNSSFKISTTASRCECTLLWLLPLVIFLVVVLLLFRPSSHFWLFGDPRTIACHSSIHGISKARILQVGCHFLFQPDLPVRDQTPGLMHFRQIFFFNLPVPQRKQVFSKNWLILPHLYSTTVSLILGNAWVEEDTW